MSIRAKRSILAVLLSLLVPITSAWPQTPLQGSPQIPLPGSAIPQFVQPLPRLDLQKSTIQTVVLAQPVTIRMCEFQSNILPPGTIAPGAANPSWVWGYVAGGACPDPATPRDTYIGPVMVAQRGLPAEVTYVNDLGTSRGTNVLAYKYSTDQTLHWADPLWVASKEHPEPNDCAMQATMFGALLPDNACAANYDGPIAATAHLHGGEVPPAIDGSPDSWFTSDGSHKGHKYYSKAVPGLPGNAAVYTYPNSQEASPAWFHDHTLGATRLNVYAGLAGGYLVTDPALNLPTDLPGVGEVVPVVIQDRQFDTSGQLFFQAGQAGGVLWTPNADHPYWSPEFVGDAIVVNGKAWPYLSVQPKRYRFLFLNGSNARTYEFALQVQATGAVGPKLWVIGTDGGYLDAPVAIDPAAGQKLVMMPGERYEVIVDFAAFRGANLLLKNTGRTPYPKGAPPQGSTLGRVMQFRVAPGQVADTSYNPASGTPLRTGAQAIPRLANPVTGTTLVTPTLVRQLTLNEVMGMPATVISPITGALTAYPGGPLEILVNNTKWSGVAHMAPPRTDFTPITVNGQTTWFSELPTEGTTELWEIVNLTADAHPMHLHLVQFQVLNRQGFNTNKYAGAYATAFPTVPEIMGCIGRVYCPGYGPPLAYDSGLTRAFGAARVPLLGGNPDIVPYLQGPVLPPSPQESGWKDTVMAPPGSVTRLMVRFAPTSAPVGAAATQLAYPFDPYMNGDYSYVWHCHIIDHEDNEMMRPYLVLPMEGATRTFEQGKHF
jgi:spore coat protein A, manganese oxidase